MTREKKEKLIRHLKYNREIGADYLITDEDADEIIKALEQEPCEDAISREDALMALTGEWTEPTDELIHRFIKRIKNLPPVAPQPETGHWIDRSEGGRIKYPWMESNECSKCGENGSAAWNYCPNCGAKMIEP